MAALIWGTGSVGVEMAELRMAVTMSVAVQVG